MLFIGNKRYLCISSSFGFLNHVLFIGIKFVRCFSWPRNQPWSQALLTFTVFSGLISSGTFLNLGNFEPLFCLTQNPLNPPWPEEALCPLTASLSYTQQGPSLAQEPFKLSLFTSIGFRPTGALLVQDPLDPHGLFFKD